MAVFKCFCAHLLSPAKSYELVGAFPILTMGFFDQEHT